MVNGFLAYAKHTFCQELLLCTYQYHPPLSPSVGKWWGFEFLKSQIPHPWGTKSIQMPTWKSRLFCSRSKVNFMNCTSGEIFQVKSDQIPHYFPSYTREGVVGNNIDRCII